MSRKSTEFFTMVYSLFGEDMDQRRIERNNTLTDEEIQEYELIKQKKSKLSANQRKRIVNKVERIRRSQDES